MKINIRMRIKILIESTFLQFKTKKTFKEKKQHIPRRIVLNLIILTLNNQIYNQRYFEV